MPEETSRNPEICVVGLAYFELHLPVDALPERGGVEHFVDDLPVSAGGALNTASVAHALGKSTLVAFPSGRGLTDAAMTREVNRLGLSMTTWRSERDPALSVVIDRQGDRSFLSKANYQALARCPGLPDANWIHVPGLREARVLEDQLREARSNGSRISVAASWAPALLERLTEPDDRPWDLLVINRHEFEEATGRSTLDPEALAHTAADIVLTDGANAVHGLVDDQRHRVDVVPTDNVVDTTGAGDAFCAGYLDARIDGADPEDAMRRAADVAADILTQRGGIAQP